VCDDASVSTSSWWDGLNSSSWLKHVHNVLQVSRFIAQAVSLEGRNVIVHCSDGWDRTAQTCSLASIMLNPHYRTITGFLALVQKEWINFGHKFSHRCGHLDGDSKEVSPVFTQFIDAVWQLSRLHPNQFEFNEKLLLDLHDHVYSCQYGTFLGNSEKERATQKFSSTTYSLWGYMMKKVEEYKNPFYSAAKMHKKGNELLFPPNSPKFVKFWIGMYNRYNFGLLPRENPTAVMKKLNKEHSKLVEEKASIEKELEALRLKAGITLSTKDASCTDVETTTTIPVNHVVDTHDISDVSKDDITLPQPVATVPASSTINNSTNINDDSTNLDCLTVSFTNQSNCDDVAEFDDSQADSNPENVKKVIAVEETVTEVANNHATSDDVPSKHESSVIGVDDLVVSFKQDYFNDS